MMERFFEDILSHLDEAVFVLDRDGSLIYVNDYLLHHAILTKDELMCLNSNALFQTGKSDINIWKLVRERKQEVTALQTIRTLNKDEKSETYLVTQTPVIDDLGQVEMSVGVMRSIADYEERIFRTQNSKSRVYQPAFQAGPMRFGWKTQPVYQSRVMAELFEMADAVAASDATVLVLGESGVGKEVLTAYLHQASSRSGKKMVAINCAALNETLLESELFGYERGAFTGAASGGKQGLIEAASGSTLFLDEVDSMPLALQSKFLRVLETREVRPVGSQKSIKVDFRVIAATNADLRHKVEQHQFREDLYYRLNILPLTIPPLRERREDIPLLAAYFLDLAGKKYGRRKILSPNAVQKLVDYHWPGNVRELRNIVERLTLMTNVSAVEIKDIPDAFFSPQNKLAVPRRMNKRPFPAGGFRPVLRENLTLKEQISILETDLIQQAVHQYGTLEKAAQALGLSKSTLIRKRRCQE